MKILRNETNKIKKIVHLADIHIRLTQRHVEYAEQFSKLYKQIEPIKDESLIVIAGDLFHNKSDLSPECVSLASEFLKTLADMCPVILIAGNHDATLTNKNRMDSLTPIVDSIRHPNVFYLMESGVFRFDEILFNNYSIFDSPDKYILHKDIPTIYKNTAEHHIALFHGPVNNAVSETGFNVTNKIITADLFDGHDIAILGDIHKFQQLKIQKTISAEESLALNKADWTISEHFLEKDTNKKFHIVEKNFPKIIYSGTLIQQNHGEDVSMHGYVLWDLKSKTYQHVEVPNDYGYFTIEIKSGELVTDISKIPKKCRLRSKCYESLPAQTKEVIKGIKEKCEIIESTFIRMIDEEFEKSKHSSKIAEKLDVQSIKNVEYQNKLIDEYFKEKKLTQEVLGLLKTLNSDFNKQLPVETKLVTGHTWKPKYLKFSNMFSYGEDNYIDFTKLSGLVGLFGPNRSGKSSIFDIVSFCLFDKFSRGFKGSFILNSQKMSFYCEFCFELNGEDFYISRTGNMDKKGNVKVDVEFWKVVNNKKIDLNGEARRDTNDIIRDYLGTYEDFIMTVLTVQKSKSGDFVDLGHSDRKDLMNQFLGLTIFDNLNKLVEDKIKENKTIIKRVDKARSESELKTLQILRDQTTKEIDNIKGLIDNAVGFERPLLENEIRQWDLKNIATVKSNFTTDDEYLSNISKYKQRIDSICKTQKEIQSHIDKIKTTTIEQCNETVLKYKSLESNEKDYLDLKNKISQGERYIATFIVEIEHKNNKLTKLKEHKFDPNCKFCTSNVFVVDAIKTKGEVDEDNNKLVKMKLMIGDMKDKLQSFGDDFENNLKKYRAAIDGLKSAEMSVQQNESALVKHENEILKITSDLNALERDYDVFKTNRDAIEHNKSTTLKIQELTLKMDKLDSTITMLNKNMMKAVTSLAEYNTKISTISNQLEEVTQMEQANVIYALYSEFTSRDGISYQIIKKVIPDIEKEVNDTLQQFVSFKISFLTDGKNIITNLSDDEKSWPLETGSGFERFASGIAIRIAIMNINNLSKPNFMAIDEGFGCSDAEHLAHLPAFFTFLRSKFDFIWIISHLDALKDMADMKLEIKKDKGYSKINNK